MPIYEYVCSKCGHKFELMRRFSDDDSEIKCPRCGEESPERSVSVFARSGGSDTGCAPAPSGG
ncbi:MAG: zinc ribbon domain-containing protein [Dehalococcoidia bacterium]